MKRMLLSIVFLLASFTLFSQVRCNNCGGRGYVIEKVYKTCTNCGGQRARTYTKVETKTCSYCNGTKWIEVIEEGKQKKKYCTHCDNGIIKTKIECVEICPKCEGRGGYYVDVEERCSKCGGRGHRN